MRVRRVLVQDSTGSPVYTLVEPVEALTQLPSWVMAGVKSSVYSFQEDIGVTQDPMTIGANPPDWHAVAAEIYGALLAEYPEGLPRPDGVQVALDAYRLAEMVELEASVREVAPLTEDEEDGPSP